MTHQRIRHVEEYIQKALSYSPCIGIVGMRQVGKSTLLKKFSQTYYTFDDDSFLSKFNDEKTAILTHSKPPIALDEIQKFPPAFDAIKLVIDQKKQMGRYIISGSVRFSARNQIRESLTGRIVTVEMFPMGLAESFEKRSSSFLEDVIHSKNKADFLRRLNKQNWASNDKLINYMSTGGLPGICFRRNPQVRSELFEQHLDTLLRRDIHLIRQVRLSYLQLKSIVTMVAQVKGQPVNMSQMARVCGTSVPTLKSALVAMEGLFLIRPYGKTWFVEDVGLTNYLVPAKKEINRDNMIYLAYHELRLQYYQSLRHEAVMKPLTTRGGIYIPFFFDFKSGDKLAIIVDDNDKPTEKSLKSITWLSKKYPKLKAVILTQGNDIREISERVTSIPFNFIF